jgi:hypothetical protein
MSLISKKTTKTAKTAPKASKYAYLKAYFEGKGFTDRMVSNKCT